MVTFIRLVIVALFSMMAIPGFSIAGANAMQGTQDRTFIMERSGAIIYIEDGLKANYQSGSYSGFSLPEGGFQEWIRILVGSSQVTIYAHGQASTEEWHANSLDSMKTSYWRGGDILFEDETATTSTILARGRHSIHYEQMLLAEFRLNTDTDLAFSLTIQSAEGSLLDDMAIASEVIKINATPAFADTDPASIRSILDGTDGTAPVEIELDPVTVEDWSDEGPISHTEWVSMPVGTTFTWNSDHWAFAFNFRSATHYNARKDATGFFMHDPEFRAEAQHFVDEYRRSFDAEDDHNRLTADWYVESLESIYRDLSVLNSMQGEDFVVVIYTGTARHGEPVVQISTAQKIEVAGGTDIRITLDFVSSPEHIADMWDSYTQHVQIEGMDFEDLWTGADVQAILDGNELPDTDNLEEIDGSTEPETVTRTSRSSEGQQAATPDDGESITAPVLGVTIDLGTSGEATFDQESYFTTEAGGVTLESFTFYHGNTVVILDVMDGDVDVNSYMLNAEQDIAATYDYTDWLDGEWNDTHSWDLYSGAYKLDYREIAYLDLVHDPDSGLYYALGIYDQAEAIPSAIAWLQGNVTIDGQGVLASADSSHIETTLHGDGDHEAEAVPVPMATVDDWAEAGLVSETEWQSPFTDTTFTWDGVELVFPFSQDDALHVEDGVTTLELRTSDRRGEIKLRTAEVDYVPADWVANLTSAENLEYQKSIGQPITILDTRVTDETGSVILLYHTDFGDPIVMINDVYVTADGVTILTEIIAAPVDIADVYAAFWDSVQSNGDYYPLTWSLEDIEALSID